MNVRDVLGVAGLLAIAATAAPAGAQVTYQFIGRDYSDGPDTVPLFSFTLPAFASSTTTTTIPFSSLTDCSVVDASLPTGCSGVELRPSFFGQDALFFYSTNQFGDGASAYNFDLGAFGAAGTYVSGIQQANGLLVKATLIVRDAGGGGGGVPEPATWALMIAGFGMTGGAMRSRRRRARIAFAWEGPAPIWAG